jgi:hypothetical protein
MFLNEIRRDKLYGCLRAFVRHLAKVYAMLRSDYGMWQLTANTIVGFVLIQDKRWAPYSWLLNLGHAVADVRATYCKLHRIPLCLPIAEQPRAAMMENCIYVALPREPKQMSLLAVCGKAYDNSLRHKRNIQVFTPVQKLTIEKIDWIQYRNKFHPCGAKERCAGSHCYRVDFRGSDRKTLGLLLYTKSKVIDIEVIQKIPKEDLCAQWVQIQPNWYIITASRYVLTKEVLNSRRNIHYIWPFHEFIRLSTDSEEVPVVEVYFSRYNHIMTENGISVLAYGEQ